VDKGSKPNVIIIMGVAGSGKTTVGEQVASKLRYEFADADDFHSAANKQKMAGGHPLTDSDREPWLASVREHIEQRVAAGAKLVVACSALRETYRRLLKPAAPEVRAQFVYLQASEELTASRLKARHAHFMKVDMLRSQFATLEAPTDAEAWIVDASLPVVDVVNCICSKL
jgi:gluconokinase